MTAIRFTTRLLLGAALVFAGTAHLTFARASFQAQVPAWLPIDADFVVIASGQVEIALGLALILVSKRKQWVGIAVALFFVAVFPGNISQWLTGTSAFGLDTDQARFSRRFFQPLLVFWAIWSTDAWGLLKSLPRKVKRPR
jgi:uncharacterized membrane protein